MAKQSIGALWLKTAKSGSKFMSGVFQPEGKSGPTYNVVVFKNDYKEQPKHPDYKIFISEPKEDDDDAPF